MNHSTLCARIGGLLFLALGSWYSALACHVLASSDGGEELQIEVTQKGVGK